MVETANEHDYGDKWDPADVALLLELGPDPALTWKQVGARLGRTGSACRSKWYRLP